MIVSIYNRTLDFKLLLESHIFQEEIMRRDIFGVSVFKKDVDHMIQR